MQEGIIKYGMSLKYVPDWSYPEALREIYQNFRDFGEFGETARTSGGNFSVILENSFSPSNQAFLKIGFSDKRCDDSAVGEHGEGLKLALLVLHRNKQEVSIQYGNTKLTPCTYEDPFLGYCFGLRIRIRSRDMVEGMRVSFGIPHDVYHSYKRRRVSDKEKIYTSRGQGSILDRPPGEVYVDGEYIAKVKGLSRAYDFAPGNIRLDRDRKVPRSFDVEYHASAILSKWEGTEVSDLLGRDATYMKSVPEHLKKKIKPKMTKAGCSFTVKGIPINSSLKSAMLKDPAVQKKVAKLSYTMSKKRSPNALMKEFKAQHGTWFEPEVKIALDILLKKSRGWVVK